MIVPPGRADGGRTISVGLIGCGDVATRYAEVMVPGRDRSLATQRIARNRRRSPPTEHVTAASWNLDVVWDVDDAAGASFARRFGIQLACSLEDLVSHPLDLVCICTPNDTHATVARSCLEAGIDVLVEHPLATRVSDGEQLRALAAASNRNVFVVRQRRFLASVQVLRRCISANALGRIERVEGIVGWNRRPAYFHSRPWRADPQNGGVVLNQGSHFLDILLYLFGDPTNVAGVLGSIGHDIGVEDSFAGQLVFGDVEADFVCTTAAREGDTWTRLVVTGSAGRVVLGGQAWDTAEVLLHGNRGSDGAVVIPEHPNGTGVAPEPLSGDHAGYLERVRRKLAGEAIEVVDAAEGIRALRLADAIYKVAGRDRSELEARIRPVIDRPGTVTSVATGNGGA